MGSITRFNVTPVKGMALEHPEEVRLTSAGIPESRRFYLVDGYDELFTGSSFGALVQIRPRYDPAEERLELRFPDGSVVEEATNDLGRATVTNFYGRGVPAHVVLGPFSAALSGYVGRPVTLMRCDRDGDGVDVHPLTIVSSSSVADLGARGKHEGPLDARRFRINIEFANEEPYEEDGWDGRIVCAGGAALRIAGQIPRCVVTTQDPETGQKDWNTLTQIAKYRPRIHGEGGLPFGMYAHVETPGSVRVADEVALSPE
jgi:uncharacterized protein